MIKNFLRLCYITEVLIELRSCSDKYRVDHQGGTTVMGSARNSLISFICITCILLISLSEVEAAGDLPEKGIAEYKAENYEEAFALLRKAREEHPESSGAAFYLGLVYKKNGNFADAAKNFEDAIRLVPSVHDAYIELIEVLYNQDRLKEAKDWIEKAEKKEIKPAHVSFLKGLVLSKEGRNQEALEAFQKAQDIDKSLTQAATLQMAMINAKERRFDKAKENLRTVLGVNPSSEIASFAKEYENALTKNLAQYKKWKFTAGLAYQYDDNAVLNPIDNTIVNVSKEKDSSLLTTLRVDYAPLLPAPWFFNGQINFYANTYANLKAYDIIAPSVSLIPGYNFQSGALSLPVSYSYVWLDQKGYMTLASVKPTLSKIVTSDLIGQLSLGYTNRELLQRALDSDENRDGSIYSISIGLVRPFMQGRGVFNLGYEFAKDDAEGNNWENSGHRFYSSLLLPASKSVNLLFSGEVFLQDYTNVHSVFDVKRNDKTYNGTVNLTWQALNSMKLYLQYIHTRDDSNISIYEYKRNVYSAGIQYDF